MKNLLILMLFCFSAVISAQTPNWTGVKETNINVSNALYFNKGIDIFTNRDGNHIIVQESNSLKYYKMNINGVAGSPIIIESSAVVSPSISGDADNIYIVYGIGSQVRVRRSTNGGTNWSLWTSFNLSTSASSMESVFSNGNLHVTYLESSIVKYSYRNYTGGSWIGPFTVSTGENGTNLRITARYDGVNNDYVYFLWQKQGTHIGNWRRYEVTSNGWGAKNFGYQVSVPDLVSSKPAGFRVTDSNIIIYFSYYAYDWTGTFLHYFNWLWRNISNNNYLGQAYPNVNWQTDRVYTTTTNDNVSHTAYYFNFIAGEGGSQPDMAIWRSKSETGYNDDVIYEYLEYPYPEYGPRYLNVSSAGNEVHAIWKDQFGGNNGNNLRYIYDDQVPLAPQNLDVEKSENNHPYLSWDANNEPDMDEYNIYKFIEDWQFVTSTSNTYYEDTDEDYCTAPPPQQCINEHPIFYRITAEDIGSNESDPSNTVKAQVLGGPPSKISIGNSGSSTIIEFSLEQNYPNPFNPTTQIKYSLSQDAVVTVKVYDMLGTEVANLVNETQTAGNHTFIFNAKDLSSGVYIYHITATQNGRILFADSKQMILLR